MSVMVSSAGPVTTARLTGEIDTYSVPDVRAAFERLPLAGGGMVVVDLREVTFLDSSGLGAIISLFHRATAGEARLQLVCGAVTLRLVQLMHLDQVMDVVTEPDDPSGPAPSSAVESSTSR